MALQISSVEHLKVVGWDIDDTLFDLFTPSCRELSYMYDVDLSYPTILKRVMKPSFDPKGDFFSQLIPGATPDDIFAFYRDMGNVVYSDCQVFPLALALVKLQLEAGTKVVFITARPEEWYDLTRAELDKHGLQDAELYHDSFKVELAKKLGVELFFDDNYLNYLNFRRANIPINLVYHPSNFRMVEKKNLPALNFNPLFTPRK